MCFGKEEARDTRGELLGGEGENKVWWAALVPDVPPQWVPLRP